MKYSVYSAIAQVEHRWTEIEAESKEEAIQKAKEWREEEDFYENRYELGDIERDTLEVHGGDEIELIELS